MAGFLKLLRTLNECIDRVEDLRGLHIAMLDGLEICPTQQAGELLRRNVLATRENVG